MENHPQNLVTINGLTFTLGQFGDLIHDLKIFLMSVPDEQWTLAHEELQASLKPFLTKEGN